MTSKLRTERVEAGKRWAFAVVPAVGLIELALHVVQTHSAVPERDWKAARAYVVSQAKPEDLVAFAPRWADPLGREHFGADVATLEREGRGDESRFPRALEVSIRGAHLPSLAGWRHASEQRFGGVTVTTWENPAPAHVLDDLVSIVGPQRMRVSHVEGGRETDCAFAHGGGQSGGLGFGPAVPANRFTCSAGFVGVSVMADPDYIPRRCIFAPPPASGSTRLRFLGVHFGRALHGHHGLYVEAEHRKGGPVTITFRVGEATIGSVVHHDGDGWKPFEFDTSDLAGQSADVVADVSVSGGSNEWRTYCFEADTR